MTNTIYRTDTAMVIEESDDDGNLTRSLLLGPTFGFRQGGYYLNKPPFQRYEYTKNSTFAAFLAAPVRRALVLGLGTGTVVQAIHERYPDAQIDVVELSAEVIELNRRYFFDAARARARIHQVDAGEFVAALGAQARYDFILCDVWSHAGVPDFVLDHGFQAMLGAALEARGVLSMNGPRHLHQSLCETLAQRFSSLLGLPGNNANLLCSHRDDVLQDLTEERRAALRSINVDAEAIARGSLFVKAAAAIPMAPGEDPRPAQGRRWWRVFGTPDT